jgi:ribonuclease HI
VWQNINDNQCSHHRASVVGKSGAGVVLYDTETNAEVWCGWKYLGETGTNNEAEYYAILLGIQCARSLGVHHLIVEGDSLLAVNQLTGAWRVREPKLKVLYDQVKEELKGLETSNIRHIRRELNSRADELANEAMDSEGSGGIDESRRSPTSSPVSSCDDDLPAESSQLEADKSYLLQFDGGSRGNPGNVACFLYGLVNDITILNFLL